MATTPAKQIIKILAANIRISNFTANGVDDVVTAVVTTALGTAGDGGRSVPLQVSANTASMGVIVAAPQNRVEIYDATTKDKISSSGGDEVYGRLVEASGVYTLSYFTLPDSGTEAAYTFSTNRAIDFEFSYRFDFDRFPSDAVVGVSTRNVSQDPASTAGALFVEQLAVTGPNAIASLTRTPTSAGVVMLIVNGVSYDTFGGAAADFSVNVSTRAITWSAANAGFSVETTDRVIAQYSTRD